MAQHKRINGFETCTIASSNGLNQATFVPERGGAISSIIMANGSQPRELLYQHDFFWDKTIDDLPGGWPFCFPVCARLERQGRRGAYLYDGNIYEMAIHGFSWSEPWQVEAETDNSVLLVLRDNDRTRAQYPFSFEVKLHYEMNDDGLICRQSYTNFGDNAMPYYAGFHPYFKTPLPQQGKEQVILNYQPTERFQYNAELTDLVGRQDLFALPTPIPVQFGIPTLPGAPLLYGCSCSALLRSTCYTT